VAGGRPEPVYISDHPADLTNVPVPRYDLLTGKGYNIVWIQTTRGCPHSCEFCASSNVYGRRYRRKKIAQIVDELVYARKALGEVRFGFADDNMLAEREFAKSLLRALIPLKIRYYLQADITFAEDREMLDLLRSSGCIHVFVGLESTVPDNVAGCWKRRLVPKYRDLIEKIQSHGIGVFGSFILGLDADEPSVIRRIADFAIETNLYCTQVSILTPLPGTRLRHRLQKEGRVLDTPWSNYTIFDVNIEHPRFSRTELERGLVDIYRQVYSQEVYWRKMDYFKRVHKHLLLASKEQVSGSPPP
jgi:radical SAM superfamily enzyme YgiQ (UPF0313 family)